MAALASPRSVLKLPGAVARVRARLDAARLQRSACSPRTARAEHSPSLGRAFALLDPDRAQQLFAVLK